MSTYVALGREGRDAIGSANITYLYLLTRIRQSVGRLSNQTHFAVSVWWRLALTQ